MTFLEAVALLREGKRVRRPQWIAGCYIKTKVWGRSDARFHKIVSQQDSPARFAIEDFDATDWEEFVEPMSFSDAVFQLSKSKGFLAIRRRAWKDEPARRVAADLSQGVSKNLFVVPHPVGMRAYYGWTPSILELMANDWELVRAHDGGRVDPNSLNKADDKPEEEDEDDDGF